MKKLIALIAIIAIVTTALFAVNNTLVTAANGSASYDIKVIVEEQFGAVFLNASDFTTAISANSNKTYAALAGSASDQTLTADDPVADTFYATVRTNSTRQATVSISASPLALQVTTDNGTANASPLTALNTITYYVKVAGAAGSLVDVYGTATTTNVPTWTAASGVSLDSDSYATISTSSVTLGSYTTTGAALRTEGVSVDTKTTAANINAATAGDYKATITMTVTSIS